MAGAGKLERAALRPVDSAGSDEDSRFLMRLPLPALGPLESPTRIASYFPVRVYMLDVSVVRILVDWRAVFASRMYPTLEGGE